MEDLVWDLTDFSHESNDFWDNGQVLIKGDSGIAQVVIEATKGDSDEGYVAVDSVFLVTDFTECETKPSDAITTNTPPTTTPAPNSLHNCEFEQDYCGWQRVGPGEFLFTRAKGEDQDGVNGPDQDHNNNKTSDNFFIPI